MHYTLQRPKHEADFEELVRKVSPLILSVPSTAEHYGRKGQSQFGVDHYFSGSQVAIQAKNVQSFSAGEALAEVNKTAGFVNPISEYHIFIACSRSTDLANAIWQLSNARVADGKFPVKLVCWEDIVMQVNTHPLIQEWYLGLPGFQSLMDNALGRVEAAQFEAAFPENIAKRLVSQIVPVELAIDFLLSWQFASNRVPSLWYDRFRYVQDALNDVQMYRRFKQAGAEVQGLSSFNLQYPGWMNSYQYLVDFGRVLDTFMSGITTCTSSYDFPDGSFMSLYAPWESPIHGATGNTRFWAQNAFQLAKYLFEYFYDGSKDYSAYGLYPAYRPL